MKMESSPWRSFQYCNHDPAASKSHLINFKEVKLATPYMFKFLQYLLSSVFGSALYFLKLLSAIFRKSTDYNVSFKSLILILIALRLGTLSNCLKFVSVSLAFMHVSD